MPSRPQLISWVICDNVHIDPATGKHYLLGCFSNIRARQFPATHPRMIWFLTLTDLKPGQHQLKLSLGRDMQNMKSVVERTVESKNPLHKLNLINEVRNVAFEEAGEYLIMVEVDDDPILVTSLGVSN